MEEMLVLGRNYRMDQVRRKIGEARNLPLLAAFRERGNEPRLRHNLLSRRIVLQGYNPRYFAVFEFQLRRLTARKRIAAGKDIQANGRAAGRDVVPTQGISARCRVSAMPQLADHCFRRGLFTNLNGPGRGKDIDTV